MGFASEWAFAGRVKRAQVGLQRDQIGLEFGLEAESMCLGVDLSVFSDSVENFAVFEFGLGDCVEFDG